VRAGRVAKAGLVSSQLELPLNHAALLEVVRPRLQDDHLALGQRRLVCLVHRKGEPPQPEARALHEGERRAHERTAPERGVRTPRTGIQWTASSRSAKNIVAKSARACSTLMRCTSCGAHVEGGATQQLRERTCGLAGICRRAELVAH
jgi:hypothetical protein